MVGYLLARYRSMVRGYRSIYRWFTMVPNSGLWLSTPLPLPAAERALYIAQLMVQLPIQSTVHAGCVVECTCHSVCTRTIQLVMSMEDKQVCIPHCNMHERFRRHYFAPLVAVPPLRHIHVSLPLSYCSVFCTLRAATPRPGVASPSFSVLYKSSRSQTLRPLC